MNYGIDWEGPANMQPSVAVPETLPLSEEIMFSLQSILERNSDEFRVDIYEEALHVVLNHNN